MRTAAIFINGPKLEIIQMSFKRPMTTPPGTPIHAVLFSNKGIKGCRKQLGGSHRTVLMRSSQSQKTTYCMIPFLTELQKCRTDCSLWGLRVGEGKGDPLGRQVSPLHWDGCSAHWWHQCQYPGCAFTLVLMLPLAETVEATGSLLYFYHAWFYN